MRSRSWRRFQRERIKSKRLKSHGRWSPEFSPTWIDTPKPCSCPTCGNPRRHFGEVTRQERLASFDLLQVVE